MATALITHSRPVFGTNPPPGHPEAPRACPKVLRCWTALSSGRFCGVRARGEPGRRWPWSTIPISWRTCSRPCRSRACAGRFGYHRLSGTREAILRAAGAVIKA